MPARAGVFLVVASATVTKIQRKAFSNYTAVWCVSDGDYDGHLVAFR